MKFFARADAAILKRIRTNWKADAEACDIDFDQPWGRSFEYAKEIVENRSDDKYGIYVLCQKSADGRPRAPWHRLVHVNHKLPRTSAAEIRFVWSQPSPHVVATSDPTTVGDHIADYLIAAMELTQGDFKAKKLRLYLPDRADQEAVKLFASVFQAFMSRGTSTSAWKFKVVPNWLLVTL